MFSTKSKLAFGYIVLIILLLGAIGYVYETEVIGQALRTCDSNELLESIEQDEQTAFSARMCHEQSIRREAALAMVGISVAAIYRGNPLLTCQSKAPD